MNKLKNTRIYDGTELPWHGGDIIAEEVISFVENKGGLENVFSDHTSFVLMLDEIVARQDLPEILRSKAFKLMRAYFEKWCKPFLSISAFKKWKAKELWQLRKNCHKKGTRPNRKREFPIMGTPSAEPVNFLKKYNPVFWGYITARYPWLNHSQTYMEGVC